MALLDSHNVVATARDAGNLEDLERLGAYTLSPIVWTSDNEIENVVSLAVKRFGPIDVLVDNAAYILKVAVEEAK